jgi:phytoene synthase
VRRDLKRMSRAEADPFQPHVRSRLSILWTLWRASRAKQF